MNPFQYKLTDVLSFWIVLIALFYKSDYSYAYFTDEYDFIYIFISVMKNKNSYFCINLYYNCFVNVIFISISKYLV